VEPFTAVADALESGLSADPELGGGFAWLRAQGDEDQDLFEFAWDTLEQLEKRSGIDQVLDDRVNGEVLKRLARKAFVPAVGDAPIEHRIPPREPEQPSPERIVESEIGLGAKAALLDRPPYGDEYFLRDVGEVTVLDAESDEHPPNVREFTMDHGKVDVNRWMIMTVPGLPFPSNSHVAVHDEAPLLSCVQKA
jgi:hypothetical protein